MFPCLGSLQRRGRSLPAGCIAPMAPRHEGSSWLPSDSLSTMGPPSRQRLRGPHKVELLQEEALPSAHQLGEGMAHHHSPVAAVWPDSHDS